MNQWISPLLEYRKQKGNPITVPAADSRRDASGIPFGLLQHILRPDLDALGFDDAEQLPMYEQCVVRRTVFGWIFLDGMPVQHRLVEPRRGNDIPAQHPEFGVDSGSPGDVLRLVCHAV